MPSRKSVASLFIALGSISVSLYFINRYAGGYHEFFRLASQVSLENLIILISLAILFYLMDYARYYSLFRVCGETLPLMLSIQMTCVSFFVSTLTPGCELYIPAVMFLAKRRGIDASKAAAVAIIKPFYLTFWVCLVSMTLLRIRRDVFLPSYISAHMFVCLLPFCVLCFILAYVIFFPHRFKAWAELKESDANCPRWQKKCISSLLQCAEALSSIGHSRSLFHLFAHVASLLFIIVYAAIGGVLAHALGIPLSPGKALAIFSSSLMVCYLAPSPGGMGMTELATAYLLDPAMTSSAIVVGAMLRFVCWYSVVVPGAFILGYTVYEESVSK